MNLDSPEEVSKLYLLIAAWGNGTSSQRGFGNTRLAFENNAHFAESLGRAATEMRAIDEPGELEQACRSWNVKHIAQAFYTKWFAFAGSVEGRSWQPLILDKNVRRTLAETLRFPLRTVAGTTDRAVQYKVYVETVHRWVNELGEPDIDAERIEYALFAHKGRALPQGGAE